jgi:hypothetical protein
MKGVAKAANKSNGLSRTCRKCTARSICNFTIMKVCSNAFKEGFRKGSKWTEKQIKEEKYK